MASCVQSTVPARALSERSRERREERAEREREEKGQERLALGSDLPDPKHHKNYQKNVQLKRMHIYVCICKYVYDKVRIIGADGGC